jgi:hypothetical protein
MTSLSLTGLDQHLTLGSQGIQGIANLCHLSAKALKIVHGLWATVRIVNKILLR